MMELKDLKEGTKGVASNPTNIFLALVMMGGTATLWKPVTDLIRGITDRQEVTNTLLCTDAEGAYNPDCLEKAWKHVIDKRLYEQAKHGEH